MIVNAVNTQREFWQNRFQSFGHTGWASQMVYAFDQPYRLKLFRYWLAQIFPEPGIALDFGCGTGDFCHVLLEAGWTVVAFDPYVRPRIRHQWLEMPSTLEQLSIEPGKFDLVVSITVLDHILDEREFQKALALFSSILKPTGTIFMIEYATDANVASSPVQAFRTLTSWQAALSKACLTISSIEPVFHPSEGSISLYDDYTNSLITKAGRSFLRWTPTKRFGSYLLKIVAALILRRLDPTERPIRSPLKKFICRKSLQ